MGNSKDIQKKVWEKKWETLKYTDERFEGKSLE